MSEHLKNLLEKCVVCGNALAWSRFRKLPGKPIKRSTARCCGMILTTEVDWNEAHT
jgi:hypothetical protein